jgi:hypothetical protein
MRARWLTTRRTTRVALFVPLLLAAFAACTSFTGDGEPPGSDGGGDGAVGSDGPSSSDATVASDQNQPQEDDAGQDAGQNLLVNGSFDLGCSNWTTANSKLQVEPTNPHGGTGSCRLCWTNATTFNMNAVVQAPAVEGTTYRADIWVRKAEDAAAPTAPGLTINVADNVQTLRTEKSALQALTAEWRRESIFITGRDGGTRILFFIGGETAGGCIVIDDASLRRTE